MDGSLQRERQYQMRRITKIAMAVLMAVVAGVGGSAMPAGALGEMTVTPTRIPVTANQTSALVTLSYSGQPSYVLMFAEVCKKSIANPTFDVTEDCAVLTRITPNGTEDGSRTLQFEVFRGDNPDQETPWGCYAEGDVAPAGFEKYTTCYIRVTNNGILNFSDDIETAFTFEVSGGDIPESPLTILLPVLGTLVALGGFVLIRRRQAIA